MLPSDFLREIAENYRLSEKEQEVFLEKFGSNKSEQAIASELHLSSSAIRNRLTGVYRKLSISGNGPVKSDQLFRFLTKKYQEYQKAHPASVPDALLDDSDIDTLVQVVRQKVKPLIKDRCGTMRLLDMSQPIDLSAIYTNVNILEPISGRTRRGIAELLKDFNPEEFDRFGLGKIVKDRVQGLRAVRKYPKLLILGKPGAGKTTFLKYVAMQCSGGHFKTQLVPIFITLKDFAEAPKAPNLLKYISQEFSQCGVSAAQVTNLLNYNRALVLLDGLDEVRSENDQRVAKEIRDFSNRFRDNHFVMTCRIAAREYTFEKFTEVEVADFDDKQIQTFAYNWFKQKDVVKEEEFLQKLAEREPIKELATNPLLLTLLCLVFEDSADFLSNRAELYKEGLDALLKKWDAKRGIQRDQVYKKLSPQRKEELLSKIALTTFKEGDYFFKQKAAEQCITEYIRSLPDANTDPEALQLDSEVVLRSIEAQHGLLVERAKGLYSFSHLTFHEYFTARELVVGKQSIEEALQNLVNQITNKRWREVYLLAVGMLPSANCLLKLMKQQVDAIMVADEKLQQVLVWINQKTLSLKVSYEPAATRAFYFAIILKPEFANILEAALDFDQAFSCSCSLATAFDFDFDDNDSLHIARNNAFALEFALDLDSASFLARSHAYSHYVDLHLALDPGLALEPELEQALQQLNEQLPGLNSDEAMFRNFWRDEGWCWAMHLMELMNNHRNISQDWQFSDEQMELLRQYYDANKLLVECLNSDCSVSREVRQEIEETLLLPIAEIEKRKAELS